MTETTHQTDPLTLRLEPRDRKRALLFIWMCPAALLVLIVGWGMEFWLSSDPEDIGTLFVILFGGGYGCWYLLYIAHSLGWYRCRFRVTPDSIEWTYPDGRIITGRWSDLKYVSAEYRLLYFGDQSKIPLKFGPGRYGEIPVESMKALVAMSGEASILARAFGEAGTIAVPDRKRFDRVSLVAASLGLFLLPVIGFVALFIYTASFIAAMGTALSLFVLPVGYLILKYNLKKSATERRFGPPKGHPSVRWHKQF